MPPGGKAHAAVKTSRKQFVWAAAGLISVYALWQISHSPYFADPATTNEESLIIPRVLSTARGLEVHILPVGAAVQRLYVPDQQGKRADVVLGFDSGEEYLNATKNPYFGATVGRVANRIKGASFSLDGNTYTVSANDGKNSLHGGKKGWSRHTWRAVSSAKASNSIKFHIDSPDGDEGYPGDVQASISYTVKDASESASELHITFEAKSSAPTPINMAQHSYFNLGGAEEALPVLDHMLRLNSSYYTPVDAERIPTGEVLSVSGTPFDFRTEHSIGSRLADVGGPEPGGYDHNMVLWGFDGQQAANRTQDCIVFADPRLAVDVWDPQSGRGLMVYSNSPGLQFYSGNFLDGSVQGKNGVTYHQHTGFALETQVFPNSINTPSFPQCILRPQKRYEQTVIWRFYNR